MKLPEGYKILRGLVSDIQAEKIEALARRLGLTRARVVAMLLGEADIESITGIRYGLRRGGGVRRLVFVRRDVS